ncbi:MAG: hypothetical protein JW715_06900 [Sedimentisphaerales bacterium]|nr:hypothetical protein [Sedimentisphaerales bacterium]
MDMINKQKYIRSILTIFLKILFLLACYETSQAAVLRVPTEYPTIQAAIDDANDSDTVLVAPGTYTGDGNWDIDFKGKAISVKSEQGPESCIIVCESSQPLGGRPPVPVSHRGFNFHSNEDANSIVCGFTVTRGDDRNHIDEGGAFYCEESSPTIRDCIIVLNAAESGGGIWARNSQMYVSNCIIIENYAYSGGGGIYIISGENCFVNCVISGNMTTYLGCGVKSEGGNHQFINCTITGNRVQGERAGSGILFQAVRENEICDLTNCIVWGNRIGSVDHEINLQQHLGVVPIFMELRIDHCLIGEDTSDIHDSYGMVSGNWLMTDPMFARNGYWDPNGTSEDLSDDFWVEGDYHLKSQAGRWDPVSESWVQDDVTSPCIDAGDLMSPIGLEPFPNGGIINMGAYGGTAEASKSYFGEPLCETIIAGDINGDCKVDLKDFAILAAHWLEQK